MSENQPGPRLTVSVFFAEDINHLTADRGTEGSQLQLTFYLQPHATGRLRISRGVGRTRRRSDN